MYKIQHLRFTVEQIQLIQEFIEGLKPFCRTHDFNWDTIADELNLKPTQWNYLEPDQIFARGGATIVTFEKDGMMATGVATCSLSDNYERRRGREIAMARALRNFKAKIVV